VGRAENELAKREDIAYVQIFENRDAMMGASNPHPHGQIWAAERVPNEPAAELAAQKVYFEDHGRSLLQDYLLIELRAGERIVAHNKRWVALVPFWAVWPFAVILLPRMDVATLRVTNDVQWDGLASLLKTVTAGSTASTHPSRTQWASIPAPCDGAEHCEWLLHAHFYPPLLRSATVRKFMVGFELLGSAQRDITPELAAATLRDAMKF
jgi:UDPglucose--hexose-1-phosphate uridylyltransferase